MRRVGDLALVQVDNATPPSPLTSPEPAWFADALEAVNALADVVYRDLAHVAVLRQRRRSFSRMAEAHRAPWWVPVGYRPPVADAEDRLSRLRERGPTP